MLASEQSRRGCGCDAAVVAAVAGEGEGEAVDDGAQQDRSGNRRVLSCDL